MKKLLVAAAILLSLTVGACLMVFALSPANAEPLPGALALFATGVAGLGLLGWRKKRMRLESVRECDSTADIAGQKRGWR